MVDQPPVNASFSDQQAWLEDSITRESPELGMLVGLVASTSPDRAEAAGHRARLDAYLALQAGRQADAMNRLTRALVVLTIVLVIVGAGQVVVAALAL